MVTHKNCCSLADSDSHRVINLFMSEGTFGGHLVKLPCHSQAYSSRLLPMMEIPQPLQATFPGQALSWGPNVPSLPCCSVPFPKPCPHAPFVCAFRESPVPSSFSSPRQQLLTAPSAQAPSLATNHAISETPTRHSGPLGHSGPGQTCSRHLTSTAVGKPGAGPWTARVVGDVRRAGRDLLPTPRCLHSWSHSPAGRLLAMVAARVQPPSHPHPDPEPLQHICLPTSGCPPSGASPAKGIALGQPVVGFCPSPSPASQSPLEGTTTPVACSLLLASGDCLPAA